MRDPAPTPLTAADRAGDSAANFTQATIANVSLSIVENLVNSNSYHAEER